MGRRKANSRQGRPIKSRDRPIRAEEGQTERQWHEGKDRVSSGGGDNDVEC